MFVAWPRRIEAGALHPIVGGVAPLAEGRVTFETKRNGSAPGKMALNVTRSIAL